MPYSAFILSVRMESSPSSCENDCESHHLLSPDIRENASKSKNIRSPFYIFLVTISIVAVTLIAGKLKHHAFQKNLLSGINLSVVVSSDKIDLAEDEGVPEMVTIETHSGAAEPLIKKLNPSNPNTLTNIWNGFLSTFSGRRGSGGDEDLSPTEEDAPLPEVDPTSNFNVTKGT